MDGPVKSPSELIQDLGHSVRALRIGRTLTQGDLATKAGVSLRSLANLERGGGSTVETLVRALNALEATDAIAQLAPQPQVSPLALLRNAQARPQRVRRRQNPAG